MCANTTVKSGVEALRIEATPDAICCCPQTISEKGITLLRSPAPRKAAHTRPSLGIRCPASRSTASRISAPSATRATTTVNTGSAATATALKKKDPPHTADRATSIAHSRGVIGRLIRAGGVKTISEQAGAVPDHVGTPTAARHPFLADCADSEQSRYACRHTRTRA